MKSIEKAPGPVRRRIGWGFLLLILGVLGWVVFKHASTGNLKDSQVQAGMSLIAEGDYDGARRALAKASSVTILDRYPAFLLAVVDDLQRWEQGQPTQVVESEFYELLAAGQWSATEQWVMQNLEEGPRRDFFLRVVRELQRSASSQGVSAQSP